MAGVVVPLARGRSGRADSGPDRTELHVRRAVELSYPLFTYAELKRVLRCEYHRLVTQLRDTLSWNEISMVTGMTRAGLNKLGEEIQPREAHNGVRTLLAMLQDAGDEGLTLPKLAGAYYERCQALDDGPSFEEALRALVDSGHVRAVDGRYVTAAAQAEIIEHRLTDGIENTVAAIAEAAREAGPAPAVAQLHRISFKVPADEQRQRELLTAIKRAVCELAEQEEQRVEGDHQWMTVVLAAAPELL
ncbi:MAG: hypothetical protein ABMA64_17425 [Myxococcota bacterium]